MAAAKEAYSHPVEPPGAAYRYAFGPFRLDPRRRKLTRAGREIVLPGKVFDTLVALVESAGRPVDNDTLMARIWPGAEPEDSLLRFNVSQVSMALGDGYIEALPPRGYRFRALVERIPVTAGSVRDPLVVGKLLWALVLIGAVAVGITLYRWTRPSSAAVAPSSQLRALAIAPFRAQSAEAAALGQALIEGLLPRFRAVPDLDVRFISASGGAKDPLQAGRLLKVDAVLHGSIQSSADQVKLTMQLSRPAGGPPIAAASFDVPASEASALESHVWRRTMAMTSHKLSPERQLELSQPATLNAEAYRLFAEARFEESDSAEELGESIQKLEQAVMLDPRYANAYASLANAYSLSAQLGFEESKVAMRKAKAAARRAVELNDRLAAAHLASAGVSFYFDWDVLAAERQLRRAVELVRHSADAYHLNADILIARGKFVEAITERRHALELDPFSPETRNQLASAYYYARDWDRALEESRRAAQEDPSLTPAVLNLAAAFRAKGMEQEAFEQYIKADEMMGARPKTLERLNEAYADGGFAAYWRRRLGLRRKSDPVATGLRFAQAGRHKVAMRWLEDAYHERSPKLVFLHVTPEADSLQKDRNFQALVKRIGIAR